MPRRRCFRASFLALIYRHRGTRQKQHERQPIHPSPIRSSKHFTYLLSHDLESCLLLGHLLAFTSDLLLPVRLGLLLRLHIALPLLDRLLLSALLQLLLPWRRLLLARNRTVSRMSTCQSGLPPHHRHIAAGLHPRTHPFDLHCGRACRLGRKHIARRGSLARHRISIFAQGGRRGRWIKAASSKSALSACSQWTKKYRQKKCGEKLGRKVELQLMSLRKRRRIPAFFFWPIASCLPM